MKLSIDAAKPVHTGEFSPGPGSQEIKFAQPMKGRYLRVESLSAHDGKSFAAAAESTCSTNPANR